MSEKTQMQRKSIIVGGVEILLMGMPCSTADAGWEKYADPIRKKRIRECKSEKMKIQELSTAFLLHRLLCTALEKDPEQTAPFPIIYTINGKPYLEGGIHFNLTHSAGMVYGAAAKVPVGIDLQKIHVPAVDKRWEKLAKRYFSDEEVRLLESVETEASRKALFTRMWTIRESYIKCKGGKITEGMSDFSYDSNKGEIREAGKLRAFFAEAEAPEGYCLTLTVEAKDRIG